MAADPRSTNVVPFPTPASSKADSLAYRRRRERPDWPTSASRRTPELLIALAVCKVLTPSQRGEVKDLLQIDQNVFNDRAGHEATTIIGGLA
jgi:hypothetical protein